MHRYHPRAQDTERVRGLRDQAATAWRGGQARREPGTQAATSLVCLYASAGAGRQWQQLQRRLTVRYQVLFPDSTAPATARRGRLTGNRPLPMRSPCSSLRPRSRPIRSASSRSVIDPRFGRSAHSRRSERCCPIRRNPHVPHRTRRYMPCGGVRLRAGSPAAGLRPDDGRAQMPGRDGRSGSATGLRSSVCGHPSPASISARHMSVMSTTPTRPASPATGR